MHGTQSSRSTDACLDAAQVQGVIRAAVRYVIAVDEPLERIPVPPQQPAAPLSRRHALIAAFSS